MDSLFTTAVAAKAKSSNPLDEFFGSGDDDKNNKPKVTSPLGRNDPLRAAYRSQRHFLSA